MKWGGSVSLSLHLAGYYGPLHLSPPMSLHSLFPSLIHPRLLTLQTQGPTELSRKEGKGKSTGILLGREKKEKKNDVRLQEGNETKLTDLIFY